jgi:hypothetical protein
MACSALPISPDVTITGTFASEACHLLSELQPVPSRSALPTHRLCRM